QTDNAPVPPSMATKPALPSPSMSRYVTVGGHLSTSPKLPGPAATVAPFGGPRAIVPLASHFGSNELSVVVQVPGALGALTQPFPSALRIAASQLSAILP